MDRITPDIMLWSRPYYLGNKGDSIYGTHFSRYVGAGPYLLFGEDGALINGSYLSIYASKVQYLMFWYEVSSIKGTHCSIHAGVVPSLFFGENGVPQKKF